MANEGLIQKNIYDYLNIVLDTELEGIKQLYDLFNIANNSELGTIIEVLFNCSGKIVVTGIGKSGYIANKFAATLTSTGTPSCYLHLAESLHGDLGIVSEGDIVICISKSGESKEFKEIISYNTSLKIITIAITEVPQSTLATLSDYSIILPASEEACFLGLAPTTSTTKCLVLCDAIAVTLLKLKKFNEQDFLRFHPGGSLGNKLKRVADVMLTKDLPLCHASNTIRDAIKQLLKIHYGVVMVVDDYGQMLGCLTEHDLQKFILEDTNIDVSVTFAMNSNFIQHQKEDFLIQLVKDRYKYNISKFFILENKVPVGMVVANQLTL